MDNPRWFGIWHIGLKSNRVSNKALGPAFELRGLKSNISLGQACKTKDLKSKGSLGQAFELKGLNSNKAFGSSRHLSYKVLTRI